MSPQRSKKKVKKTVRSTTKRSAAKPEPALAGRIRKVLARRRGISEKRMFGGICFFANGNMIGGASGKEELIVRVGPDRHEACLAEPFARPMDFTNRPMRGFVYVDPPGIGTAEDLRYWIDKGIAYARSLPSKTE